MEVISFLIFLSHKVMHSMAKQIPYVLSEKIPKVHRLKEAFDPLKHDAVLIPYQLGDSQNTPCEKN